MLIPKANQFSRRFYLRSLSSSSARSDQTAYLNRHLDHFLSDRTSDSQTLLQSHALILTTGNSSNVFIAAKLISLYSSLKESASCNEVFNSVKTKDIFLWNSIIKTHFSTEDYPLALEYYLRMRLSDTPPDHFTIPMVATSCAELHLLNYGKKIHGLVFKLAIFCSNSAVGSSFVFMYCKCGLVDDAYNVFDEMSIRDVVAWTALVIGCVQNEENQMSLKLLCEMHRVGGARERPNFRTMEGGFLACGKLGAIEEGRCLHGLILTAGMGRSPPVQSLLLALYSKYGDIREARLAFSETDGKDLISWTSITGVYARMGCVKECLDMFWEVQAGGINTDGILVSCVISAFSNSIRILEGMAFHGLILRRNYVLDQSVCNSLMLMYCKFGLLIQGERLLGIVCEGSKESWNTLVSAHGKQGSNVKCLELFRDMQSLGIEPDSNSLVAAISSCSQLGATHLGLSLHCHTIKHHRDENVIVANSLLDFYGKHGAFASAWRIFHSIKRDTATWNTLLSSYVQAGRFSEAMLLFDKMGSEDTRPNSRTMVIMLSACSHLASLEWGERIHNFIKRERIKLGTALATALIDLYAKCGRLEKSREIFDAMGERDVISWNAMISGYALHGDGKSSGEIFQQMVNSGVTPDGPTFLALLSACSHAGLVEEGKYFFGRMKCYSVESNLKHYTCMVDLIGRHGNLVEAEALVFSMPFSPDKGVWGAMLNACNIHNEVEIGERVAVRAIESDPGNDGYYIMLSRIYSSSGRWEEAEKVREMMKRRGVQKEAGWSTV